LRRKAGDVDRGCVQEKIELQTTTLTLANKFLFAKDISAINKRKWLITFGILQIAKGRTQKAVAIAAKNTSEVRPIVGSHRGKEAFLFPFSCQNVVYELMAFGHRDDNHLRRR
jgi:hypothetical protein